MGRQVIAATWIARQGEAVLGVRPHYSDAFFLPGGVPDAGETYADAAAREVAEELGLRVDAGSLREVVRIEDQAYGRAAGDIVVLICFEGTSDGTPCPGEEIAEVAWLPPSQWHEFAPAVQKALAELRSR